MELVMPSEDRAAIEERLREIRNRLSEQGGASFPTASEHGGMLAEQERLQARLRQLKAGGLIANPKPGGVLPLPRRGSGTGGPVPPGPDAVAEGPPRPSRRPWMPGGIMGGGFLGRSPGSALAGLAGSAGVAGPGGPVGERGPVGAGVDTPWNPDTARSSHPFYESLWSEVYHTSKLSDLLFP